MLVEKFMRGLGAKPECCPCGEEEEERRKLGGEITNARD